jgi:hypothetical protein
LAIASTPHDPEFSMPAQSMNATPFPDAEVFEAVGDNARFHVWAGDRFVVHQDDPVVTLVRLIPREEFEALRASDPSRLQIIRSAIRRLLHAV